MALVVSRILAAPTNEAAPLVVSSVGDAVASASDIVTVDGIALSASRVSIDGIPEATAAKAGGGGIASTGAIVGTMDSSPRLADTDRLLDAWLPVWQNILARWKV